jgi:hypothetical protein
LIILFVFGGRQIFPKVAWQEFPNWQKVSIESVAWRIESSLNNNPKTGEVNLEGLNIERDAYLMLESGTTDLFVDKNLASKYNFKYNRESNIIEINEK